MSGSHPLLVLGILLGLALTACRPQGFEAQAWNPPKNQGLLDTIPPNHELTTAQGIGGGQWTAPEEIAIDAEGRVYAGSLDGTIYRTKADGGFEKFSKMSGQVLGLDFDKTGHLYACVDRGGLWLIDPAGLGIQILDSFEGHSFGLLDDVKVGPDGMVYFSEATNKYHMATHLRDILEGKEAGRLFRFNPETKKLEVLLDHLGFANGISVAEDGSYVLVSETSRYRIRKFMLQGPNAGKDSIFMDNLPGFPDGLSHEADGQVWVAFISLRSSLLDTLHPMPFFKELLVSLPEKLLPKEKSYGLIASFDRNGKWLQSLHDPEGTTVPGITSIEPHRGRLWLGNLHGTEIYSVEWKKGSK